MSVLLDRDFTFSTSNAHGLKVGIHTGNATGMHTAMLAKLVVERIPYQFLLFRG